MAKLPTKGYDKYFELNANEHIIYVLTKDYKQTKDGNTLCAITFTLKRCQKDFETFEKLVSYLYKEGIVDKVWEFAGNSGDKMFAFQIKDKLADIKLAEFYSQREREI